MCMWGRKRQKTYRWYPEFSKFPIPVHTPVYCVHLAWINDWSEHTNMHVVSAFRLKLFGLNVNYNGWLRVIWNRDKVFIARRISATRSTDQWAFLPLSNICPSLDYALVSGVPRLTHALSHAAALSHPHFPQPFASFMLHSKKKLVPTVCLLRSGLMPSFWVWVDVSGEADK